LIRPRWRATAVVETVDYVAANSTPIPEEKRQWDGLKQAAMKLLAKTPDPAAADFIPKASNTAEEARRPLTKYEMGFGE